MGEANNTKLFLTCSFLYFLERFLMIDYALFLPFLFFLIIFYAARFFPKKATRHPIILIFATGFITFFIGLMFYEVTFSIDRLQAFKNVLFDRNSYFFAILGGFIFLLVAHFGV
jgi:hypothetical protein